MISHLIFDAPAARDQDSARADLAAPRTKQLVAAAILASIVLVLGGLRLAPHVSGVYHDDGIYVATAKALAEGQGYTLINLPGAPAQTKYPILYPAVLASIWLVWPEYPANLLALQAVSLVFAALAVGLAYLYLVRQRLAGPKECFAAGLLCATSPTFLYFATQTLSEAMFALLLVVSLWSLETASVAHGRSALRSVVTGMSVALPFLCRSLGACIPPVVFFQLKRRSLPVMATICAAAITAAPWMFWLALHRTPGDGSVFDYYTASNYLGWWFTDAPARVPLLNLRNICFDIAALPLAGFVELTFRIIWPAVLAFGILVFREMSRKIGTPMVLAASVYLVIILLWPWRPERFLVPWLPLLTVFVVLAAQRVLALRPGRAFLILGRVLFALAVLANVGVQLRIAAIVKETGYPHRSIPDTDVSWAHYDEMFAWVRENTPADAIIASGLDSMVFLHTGRRGFRPFVQQPTALFYGSSSRPLGTAEEFARVLRDTGAGYLLELPMPEFPEEEPLSELIRETLTRRPGCLRVVRTVEQDRRFVLYEVNRGACARAVRRN